MTDSDTSKMIYEGPELNNKVMAMILTRKFDSAVAVLAGRTGNDKTEVWTKLSQIEQEPHKKPDMLMSCGSFVSALNELAEMPDDSLFRGPSAFELYNLVSKKLSEAAVALCAALWLHEGAYLPDGLVELLTDAPDEEE